MKPVKNGRKRNNQIHLFVNDEELKAINERMKRCNIDSISIYARKMMIDGYVLVIDDSKELKEFSYELNKIGHNINQIAHALNAGHSVPKEKIDEIQEMMVTIWQYQRYILSGTPF